MTGSRRKARAGLALAAGALALVSCVTTPRLPAAAEIDRMALAAMRDAGAQGLSVALIEDGEVAYVKSFGLRDVATAKPLTNDTVMYGASLTKTLFSAMVMQLVDEGRIDLDRPIAALLPRPLPEYPGYADLKDDPRWRGMTMRMLLGHSPGFANFRYFPPEGGYVPDGKLKIYFAPGTRYAYSGEGYYLAQLVLEQALGLDVGAEMQRRIFAPAGMSRTSMTWRADFADNNSTGYTADDKTEPHDHRENVRAAGSMDTTIADMARFTAAFISGRVVGDKARREMLRPGIAIASAHQFPPLGPATDPRNAKVKLSAGIGVVTWQGQAGRGFWKGGHNDSTDNMLVCLERGRRCVVLLSNAAKGERMFPKLVEALLGPTDLPWRWEYSSLDAR